MTTNKYEIIVPALVERLRQTDFDCVIYSGIVTQGNCQAIHDYSFRELSALYLNGSSVPLPTAWHVMEWLRQDHGYHLSLVFDKKGGQWCWAIYRLWTLSHSKSDNRMLKTPVMAKTCDKGFDTWASACKDGIETAMDMI